MAGRRQAAEKGRKDTAATKTARATDLQASSMTEKPMFVGGFGEWILRKEERQRERRGRWICLEGVPAAALMRRRRRRLGERRKE